MSNSDEKRMYDAKWQPMLVILREGDRLECACGALATIVIGSLPDDPSHYNQLKDVDVWCQPCFVKAQDAAKTEPLQGDDEAFDTLSKDGVRATLQSLANEYTDASRHAQAVAEGSSAPHPAVAHMVLASMRDAQKDAVYDIATSLGITLEKQI